MCGPYERDSRFSGNFLVLQLVSVLFFAGMIPVAGRLADSYGRRTVLLIVTSAIILFGLSFNLLAIATRQQLRLSRAAAAPDRTDGMDNVTRRQAIPLRDFRVSGRAAPQGAAPVSYTHLTLPTKA